MKTKLTITVSSKGDWWSATCEEIDCGGFGSSKEIALRNLFLSVSSTIASKALRFVQQTDCKQQGIQIDSGVSFDQTKRFEIPFLNELEAA